MIALVAVGCGGGRSGSTNPALDPGQALSAEELARRVAELELAAQSEPGEPYYPFQIAQLHLRAGQSAQADLKLREALVLDPNYAPAISWLSKLHFEQGQHETAIQLLEDARARMGSEFPPQLVAGLALHQQAAGREDESATLFSQLERSGVHPGAVTYHLLSSDGFLTAHEKAARAVESEPKSAANRNNLGIALLYRGRPDEARAEFERALELNPELPGPMYNLAIVERFYFFDETASREWLSRYLQYSDYDPDGLQEIFADQEASR